MYYFIRWTDNPNDDAKRNFSGHMQAGFKTKEAAYKDYEEEKIKGRYLPYEPKQDPTTGYWNSDPEWGISGFYFKDETSYNQSISQAKEISWFHQENKGQQLYLFSAELIGDEQGFDGEETFRNIKPIVEITLQTSYNEVLKIIKMLHELRKLIRKILI